jgi:hypothetical protein
LLLVAPGLLFDLLSQRRRVGAAESTFREISRVVLASLGFTAIGVLAVGIIRTVHAPWMPDPKLLLIRGHSYVIAHYGAILWAMVTEASVALACAAALHLILSSRKEGPPLRSVSSWTTVLREECPTGRVPYVRIRQTDGNVLMGHVGQYSADLDQDDREIVLVPPLFAKPVNGELQPLPPEWQRVVVPGSAVTALTVEYRVKPHAGPTIPGQTTGDAAPITSAMLTTSSLG